MPTYYRMNQLAEITRLAQALLPASETIPVKWLVFDEFEKSSAANLKRLKAVLEPYETKSSNNISVDLRLTHKVTLEHTTRTVKSRGKGTMARRMGVEYLRKVSASGILYFADDDNTYDSELFSMMMNIERVGMWPVGSMNKWTFSSPIVLNGQIMAFYDGYTVNRKFPVDFAGFALNLDLIHENPDANVQFSSGYMESYFLSDLRIQSGDLRPKASNCTQVLAWHSHTIRQDTEVQENGPFVKAIFGDIGPRDIPDADLPLEIQNTNIPILLHHYLSC